MAITTDESDPHEENDGISQQRPSRRQDQPSPPALLDVMELLDCSATTRRFTRKVLRELLQLRDAGAPQQQVVQSAGEVRNIFIQGSAGVQVGAITTTPSLAAQRQKFHFEFLKQAMKQAEWTFRLSVYFMTAGAVVILVGAVLALIHAGSSNGYVPLVTGLSGVLITTGGGALALHSKRTMANLTKAAEVNEAKIDADHQLETATTFIDRVEDKDAKDRLNSAAALKALNIQPDADTMFNRLLPGDQSRESPGEPAD
ncbi:hypothetical protein ACIRPX_16070 [Streptomyces sp. NPDC101225]|uniref:TRADD-N-associated membrane domain-containing protein n=1 Tax=Streptomyces sp. NPDC101225 TaxID=3366135 RepID=UPI003820357C